MSREWGFGTTGTPWPSLMDTHLADDSDRQRRRGSRRSGCAAGFPGARVGLGTRAVDGAYRGINWTTVVLVAGMTPLSVAMTQTGAADLISGRRIGIVGPLGPYALLAGLFVLTATFGQLISNMATALIVIHTGEHDGDGVRGLQVRRLQA
jgi:hypothetical protein